MADELVKAAYEVVCEHPRARRCEEFQLMEIAEQMIAAKTLGDRAWLTRAIKNQGRQIYQLIKTAKKYGYRPYSRINRWTKIFIEEIYGSDFLREPVTTDDPEAFHPMLLVRTIEALRLREMENISFLKKPSILELSKDKGIWEEAKEVAQFYRNWQRSYTRKALSFSEAARDIKRPEIKKAALTRQSENNRTFDNGLNEISVCAPNGLDPHRLCKAY